MNSPAHPAGHVVQFFENDADHINTVADFVKETIDAGQTCIVVASAGHRRGINARLHSFGIDVPAMAARYQYIELDASTLLSSFMDGSRCNHARFHQMFDTLMRQAASRGEPVRAYGEMVSLLLEDGLADAALELEELWNELSRQHQFTLFCSYSAPALASPACTSRTIERIRAVHSHVIAS